jgi:hypothetical protein
MTNHQAFDLERARTPSRATSSGSSRSRSKPAVCATCAGRQSSSTSVCLA